MMSLSKKKYPSVIIKVDTVEFDESPYKTSKKFSINGGEFKGVIHENLHMLIKTGKTNRLWYLIPSVSDVGLQVICVAVYPEIVKIGN
jgi:hypothetical protein